MNLRKLARDKPCQIRIPFVCNGDPSTTVLAHIRRGGVAGMGQKPPDVCGLWACSDCHDVMDGRVKTPYSQDEINGMILDGLCRTLHQLWGLGAVD